MKTDLVAILVDVESRSYFDVETLAQVFILGVAIEFYNLCFARQVLRQIFQHREDDLAGSTPLHNEEFSIFLAELANRLYKRINVRRLVQTLKATAVRTLVENRYQFDNLV